MRPTLLALFACATLSAADIKVTPNEAVDVAQDGKVVARFMMSHDVGTQERGEAGHEDGEGGESWAEAHEVTYSTPGKG